MLSIPPPCVRQSLQAPPRLRRPHHSSHSPQRLHMDRPSSRKRGSTAGCPARTLFPNLMAPCAVLPTIPSLPRNAARSRMEPCPSRMLLALAIVVRVRYGSTASGTGHPPRKHGVSVRCCIHTARPLSSTKHARRLLLLAPFCGETGSDAAIGASW